jgi:hypothetical protein
MEGNLHNAVFSAYLGALGYHNALAAVNFEKFRSTCAKRSAHNGGTLVVCRVSGIVTRKTFDLPSFMQFTNQGNPFYVICKPKYTLYNIL